MTTPGGFDFARAAALLTDAAARAGAAIMGHFREAAEVEFKSDKSPVTRADRDSEAIILEALARLAPDVSVVSEEACGGTIGPLPERFFLVDPLDGTKEFIKKRTDFTVNIALIEDGRPRFGLVYAPARAAPCGDHCRGQGSRGRACPKRGRGRSQSPSPEDAARPHRE